MSKTNRRKISGWLLFNKPYGMSSTAAVNKVKYLLNAQKAGHAGTLDPLATGMLPIAFGEATKTIPYIMDGKKYYEFTICWGQERNTDDLEGEITNNSTNRPSRKDILQLLPKYLGKITQIPPQYSAIKIKGQRAYQLARQNINIALPPRLIEIYELKLLAHKPDGSSSSFATICSKGTYIRSIARHMGQDLNCYGYIFKLHRTKIEPFTKQMLNLEQLEKCEVIDNILLPINQVLKNFDNYEINETQLIKIQNGQQVFLPNISNNKQTICVSHMDRVIALGLLEENLFKPKRVFNY